MDGVVIVLIVEKVQPKPDRSYADVALELPFTIQKLINRIKAYLPSEEKDLLKIGPICLNIKQKQVNCMGNTSQLTSRQVLLLKTLMEHPGEVIERKDLFSSVWATEYTGDTRSLDVHIGWLRKALEVDPHNPKYLKTIRGVGFRLDI
jgi:DNA-binding response OmpR family regulator